MKILIFANKETGYNCLKFLLEEFNYDKYVVVIPQDCIKEIRDILVEKNVEFYLQSEESINRIKNLPDLNFDWLLNLWGSYIFKSDILGKAKRSLNIHPSLLPHGRGMDPIVWSLRYRFPAGVTLHSITEGIDEGPIWVQEEVEYGVLTRGEELYENCLKKATSLFCRSWPYLRSTEKEPIEQKDMENQKTFKRKEFIRESFLDLDSNPDLKDFVYRIQAHDFSGDYKLKVRMGGENFLMSLNLKKTE